MRTWWFCCSYTIIIKHQIWNMRNVIKKQDVSYLKAIVRVISYKFYMNVSLFDINSYNHLKIALVLAFWLPADEWRATVPFLSELVGECWLLQNFHVSSFKVVSWKFKIIYILTVLTYISVLVVISVINVSWQACKLLNFSCFFYTTSESGHM